MQQTLSSKLPPTVLIYADGYLLKICSLTPIDTVVEAYEMCLTQPTIIGQLIECSVKKHIFLPLPEMANGAATKRACTVWEPLFKEKHHEKSGLPNTII